MVGARNDTGWLEYVWGKLEALGVPAVRDDDALLIQVNGEAEGQTWPCSLRFVSDKLGVILAGAVAVTAADRQGPALAAINSWNAGTLRPKAYLTSAANQTVVVAEWYRVMSSASDDQADIEETFSTLASFLQWLANHENGLFTPTPRRTQPTGSDSPPPQLLAAVNDAGADLQARTAAIADLRAWYEARDRDDQVAQCDYLLGVAALSRNDLEEATFRLEAARSYFEMHDSVEEVAGCDLRLGAVAGSVGNYAEARRLFEAARAYFETRRMHDEVASCDQGLGHAAESVGDHAEAQSRFEAARAYFETHGMHDEVASCDQGIGNAARAVGNYDEARTRLKAARAYYQSRGSHEQVAQCDYNLGNVAHARNDHQEALRRYKAAYAYYNAEALESDVADCDYGLAVVARATGDYDEARRRYYAVQSFYEAQGPTEMAADCDYGLGNVALLLGDLDEASRLIEAARLYYRGHKLPEKTADCEYVLAHVASSIGDDARACQLFETARAYYQAHGLAQYTAECDYRLAHVLWELRGDVCGALTLAVRAAVQLDQLRYRLAWSGDRMRWSRNYAQALGLALKLAQQAGDRAMVAQLVEAARVQGVPTPERADQDILGVHLSPLALKAALPAAVGGPSTAGIALGADEGALGPPHGVCLKEGDPSLATSAGLDDTADVVSIASQTQAVGGDGAWWWGSWAAAKQLHWFLYGPGGELEVGAIPMEKLDPLLEDLASALPEPKVGENDSEFSARVKASYLASAGEAAWAWEWGQTLIPDVLRDLLGNGSAEDPIPLVIAPAPEIAQVPFPWMSINESGSRLIERAAVRLGASIGLLHEASHRRPSKPGNGLVAVVDPGGGSLFASRAVLPCQVAEELASRDPDIILTRRSNLGCFARHNLRVEAATPARLRERLVEHRPSVLFYLGHAGRGGSPMQAHLVLEDGRVHARDLFVGNATMADSVVLIACGGARHDGPEWLGLAPAAVYAGARTVLAALWNLVWDPLREPPTYRLALDALDAARRTGDLSLAWRQVQLRKLARWRAGQVEDAAPIYWAGIVPIGIFDTGGAENEAPSSP